ncbi:MAG: AEC family transporter [Ruminiclostridium sp.]|nr:AEC family transporter [Ruminiclostridium sp.]
MGEAFLFAANAVLPIVILIALGYVIKRIGLLGKDFFDAGNKLVFRVLLPVMLFCNVYKIESISDVEPAYMIFGVTAVILIFLIAIPVCCAFTKDGGKRGVLIQAIFRSNYAIIGIPLAESLFGDAGAVAAGVMLALVVPLFNMLGVISLSVFNGSGEAKKADIGKILFGIVTNPLIIGTAAGFAVLCLRIPAEQLGITFRLSDITPLYKALDSIKTICTPFALIVLGGRFEFSAVAKLRREIIFGTALRNVAVPLIGFTAAYLLKGPLGLSGEHFAAFVGVFATPVAVSSAVMAKEMGGDDELAGQLVVWTSLFSTVTIFVYVTILKMLGIF